MSIFFYNWSTIMRTMSVILSLLIIILGSGCSSIRENIRQPDLVPVYTNGKIISTNDDRLPTGKLERTIIIQTTDPQDQVFKWYQSRLKNTNLQRDSQGTSPSNIYFQDSSCPHYYLTVDYDAGKVTVKFSSYDCI